MIITKDQYEKYIIPCAILRRTIHNEHGTYISTLEVTSEPYDHKMRHGDIIKRFKYRSINGGYEGEYFVSDLFNGTVEVLNWETFLPFLNDDEFQV